MEHFQSGPRVVGRLAVGSAAVFALWANPALAQQEAAPAPIETPPPPSAPAAGEPQLERAPDTFPIYAIDVGGVTKLPAGEIERIVYRYTGERRTGKDVEAARKAIQAAYEAHGLEAVVVEIPAQPTELFQQGIVQIQVSESPVGRVRVVDSSYHSLTVLRDQVPSLKEGEPLNLPELQRDIESANRFPDRMVTPVFRPGQVPGTVDVDLRVDSDFPLHSVAEINNDYSPNTTNLRATGTVRYSNLWEHGHTVSFTWAVAPRNPDESKVFSGSYTAPLIGTPWTMLVYGYTSNSNVAALGGTNVLGDGYQIGLRAIYRLPSEGNFQSIAFGPDYKDFKQDIFVGGIAAGAAPIRYVPVTLEYNFASAGATTSLEANIGATYGVRVMKRTTCVEIFFGQPCVPIDQFRNRAFESNENFVRLNAGLTYSYADKNDFVAVVRLAGQFADSPLVTNEQFSAGGLTSVRGYLQSEAVGDDGFVSSLEVRTASLAPLLGRYVDELRFYAFMDSGVTFVRDSLPGQQDEFRLVSVGLGGRIRLFDFLSGEIVVGVPLRDGPTTRERDPRVTFVARGEF